MGLPLVSLCARRLKGDHGFQGPTGGRSRGQLVEEGLSSFLLPVFLPDVAAACRCCEHAVRASPTAG